MVIKRIAAQSGPHEPMERDLNEPYHQIADMEDSAVLDKTQGLKKMARNILRFVLLGLIDNGEDIAGARRAQIPHNTQSEFDSESDPTE